MLGYEPVFEVAQSGHKDVARRIVVRADDIRKGVLFLCNGWASRSTAAPNGRQLLSVLLPGDIVSAQLVVGQANGWFIDSITAIAYRSFDRDEILDVLKMRPQARTTMLNVVAREIERSDDFIVHLGRGSAEERIAYLITNIVNRLQRLGMAPPDAEAVFFPLRQHHIGDATGLTSVHVSNILRDFRKRHMIELTERRLTILDWKQLLKLATLHAR